MFVDVLHHTAEPDHLLEEAARVARRRVIIKSQLCDGPTLRPNGLGGKSRSRCAAALQLSGKEDPGRNHPCGGPSKCDLAGGARPLPIAFWSYFRPAASLRRWTYKVKKQSSIETPKPSHLCEGVCTSFRRRSRSRVVTWSPSGHSPHLGCPEAARLPAATTTGLCLISANR